MIIIFLLVLPSIFDFLFEHTNSHCTPIAHENKREFIKKQYYSCSAHWWEEKLYSKQIAGFFYFAIDRHSPHTHTHILCIDIAVRNMCGWISCAFPFDEDKCRAPSLMNGMSSAWWCWWVENSKAFLFVRLCGHIHKEMCGIKSRHRQSHKCKEKKEDRKLFFFSFQHHLKVADASTFEWVWWCFSFFFLALPECMWHRIFLNGVASKWNSAIFLINGSQKRLWLICLLTC